MLSYALLQPCTAVLHASAYVVPPRGSIYQACLLEDCRDFLRNPPPPPPPPAGLQERMCSLSTTKPLLQKDLKSQAMGMQSDHTRARVVLRDQRQFGGQGSGRAQ